MVVIKEICKLNCMHKDDCNKKFNEILESTKDKTINISAECGRFFCGVEKDND